MLAVLTAFDEVWGRTTARLDGLTDLEWAWEPVAGCWTVRRGDDGRLRVDGEAGDAPPEEDPPPFTTIAWRLEHIRLGFVGFGDRLFFEGTVTLDDIDVARSAADAVAALHRDYQRYWREPLAALPEHRWHTPIGPAFGPYAERTATDLALHVLDELVHHAAEVGVLRDLYRLRSDGGARGPSSRRR